MNESLPDHLKDLVLDGPQVVAFTGGAGNGKDVAADYLVEYHGYTKLRFADCIKDVVALILGVPVSLLESRAYKDSIVPAYGVTPRYMLQTLGDEWGRQMINPDIWVMMADRKLGQLYFEKVVFSDLRYDNEADLIHSYGGTVVLLDRGLPKSIDDHSSELGISTDNVDKFIFNTGTITDLKMAVFSTLSMIEPVQVDAG